MSGRFAAARDASCAAWIAAAVRPFDYTVGSVVPPGFEAYARVFHPAHASSRSDGPESLEVRWAEVAAANSRIMHPAAEWGSIIGSWDCREQAGVWDKPPLTGSLPAQVARRLTAVLEQHTRVPEPCWFGVWTGRGPLDVELAAAPRFELPNREMWLLRGTVRAAAVSPYPRPRFDSVNVWWPEDRTWCVSTDVDLMTTYVGGSADCICALLGETSVEALAVSVDQRVTWDADTVNPLPAPP